MIEQYMWCVWLGVFILTFIAEATTQDLVAIWFSLGSLIALILSAFPVIPWYVEIVIFAFVSLLAFGLTRPFVKKILDRTTRYTNIDELIGMRVKVLAPISKFESGEVKIHDIVYHANLLEEETQTIPTGEIVEIVTFKGNKVIVKKVN